MRTSLKRYLLPFSPPVIIDINCTLQVSVSRDAVNGCPSRRNRLAGIDSSRRSRVADYGSPGDRNRRRERAGRTPNEFSCGSKQPRKTKEKAPRAGGGGGRIIHTIKGGARARVHEEHAGQCLSSHSRQVSPRGLPTSAGGGGALRSSSVGSNCVSIRAPTFLFGRLLAASSVLSRSRLLSLILPNVLPPSPPRSAAPPPPLSCSSLRSSRVRSSSSPSSPNCRPGPSARSRSTVARPNRRKRHTPREMSRRIFAKSRDPPIARLREREMGDHD